MSEEARKLRETAEKVKSELLKTGEYAASSGGW